MLQTGNIELNPGQSADFCMKSQWGTGWTLKSTGISLQRGSPLLQAVSMRLPRPMPTHTIWYVVVPIWKAIHGMEMEYAVMSATQLYRYVAVTGIKWPESRTKTMHRFLHNHPFVYYIASQTSLLKPHWATMRLNPKSQSRARRLKRPLHGPVTQIRLRTVRPHKFPTLSNMPIGWSTQSGSYKHPNPRKTLRLLDQKPKGTLSVCKQEPEVQE